MHKARLWMSSRARRRRATESYQRPHAARRVKGLVTWGVVCPAWGPRVVFADEQRRPRGFVRHRTRDVRASDHAGLRSACPSDEWEVSDWMENRPTEKVVGSSHHVIGGFPSPWNRACREITARAVVCREALVWALLFGRTGERTPGWDVSVERTEEKASIREISDGVIACGVADATDKRAVAWKYWEGSEVRQLEDRCNGGRHRSLSIRSWKPDASRRVTACCSRVTH